MRDERERQAREHTEDCDSEREKRCQTKRERGKEIPEKAMSELRVSFCLSCQAIEKGGAKLISSLSQLKHNHRHSHEKEREGGGEEKERALFSPLSLSLEFL